MTNVRSIDTTVKTGNPRAQALAARLEEGARSLAVFAAGLTTKEWSLPVPHDGRPIGVVIHHVASVYPVEIQLAQTLAAGQPVTGVTAEAINHMNADHARTHGSVGKEETLELLQRNSAAAAAAIRVLSDQELDQAARASLYGDAPITCQFMLEDHAVRHSYHHLARLRDILVAAAA